MDLFWHSFWTSLGSTLGVITGLLSIPLLVVVLSIPFAGRAKKAVAAYNKAKQDEEKAKREN